MSRGTGSCAGSMACTTRSWNELDEFQWRKFVPDERKCYLLTCAICATCSEVSYVDVLEERSLHIRATYLPFEIDCLHSSRAQFNSTVYVFLSRACAALALARECETHHTYSITFE